MTPSFFYPLQKKKSLSSSPLLRALESPFQWILRSPNEMNPPCATVKETQGFTRTDSETLALFVSLKFLRAILFKRSLTAWHYLFFFFFPYCNLNASISTFNAVPKVEANTFITPPRMMWLGSVDPIVFSSVTAAEVKWTTGRVTHTTAANPHPDIKGCRSIIINAAV